MIKAKINHLETALRQSEERFKLMVDAIQDYAIFMIDVDGKVATWNTGAERIKGHTADQIIGQPYDLFFPPEEIAAGTPNRLLAKAREEGQAREKGWRVRRDGTRFFADALISAMFDRNGRLQGYTKVTRDITQRIAFEELRETQERTDIILENINDGLEVFDDRGILIFCNDIAAKIAGGPVDTHIGRNILDISERMGLKEDGGARFPEWPVRNALAGESVTRNIGHYRDRAGEERWLLVSATPVKDADGAVRMAVVTFNDVSELKKAEKALGRSQEQLRQSQKMDAVGRLAGGVAHDFNNLLTAINGYASLLLEMADPADPKREAIEEIQRAGEKAASLTNQLLVFSRQQVVAMKIVDLNKLVMEMEKLLHRLIGEDLELSSVLDPHLGKVKVDPGQIEQVILNLTVNARDAMPGGGKLVIRTSIAEVGSERASDVSGGRQMIKPGTYAQLSISDTGIGMSEETKSRLFEPFFTTKEPGKGTGLGLSMVFGIVEQAGGRIEVESEPGRGSTFTILFPILPASDESVPAVAVDSSYADLGGTETILVVEDDSFVRKLVTNVLQRAGYRVLEAERGDAALRILETEERDPELLLTDLVMAGMSGSQLADKVAHSRPGIKIVFMSGYTSDAAAVKGIMDSTVAFLQKPFSPIRLLQKIRESLGKRLPASK